MGEYLGQLAADKKVVDRPAEWFEREGIVDDVGDLGPFGDRFQVVLVLPKSVGTEPLLIDAVIRRVHVGDLRDPAAPQAGKRFNPIGHDAPRINPVGIGGLHPELQRRWCDQCQVSGI